MGRRRALSNEVRVRMLLGAVADHPWARPELIQAESGLSAREIKTTALPLALEGGLVERGDVPDLGRAPRRLGWTPKGAARLGRSYSQAALADALLRALQLDSARALLTEWAAEADLIWSLSPFTLPSACLRPPPRQARARPREEWKDLAFRSLRLDGLACLKLGQGRYLNVALLADPGDVQLAWMHQQFRSAHAWSRRAEFAARPMAFPLFVVITTSRLRQSQLVQLWCEAAPWGTAPRALRVTTLEALERPARERHWWNQLGRRTALWGGAVPCDRPSLRPAGGGWWGAPAASEAAVFPGAMPYPVRRGGGSLIRWATGSPTGLARLIRQHLRVSRRARQLLDRIGQYPLITARELAVVMGVTSANARAGTAELEEHKLIEHPRVDEAGYVLTWHGLGLLAAQGGHRAEAYARLRRWPVRLEGRRWQYAAGSLLASRAHTRRVLDFLVGLRRRGPAARLALRTWDHVLSLHQFPARESAPGARSARVIPDASGTVRAFGRTPAQYVDTDFWLEVDRHTRHGRALRRKLARYYDMGGPWAGTVGRVPRLLILVEHEDEARLQALRRRLIELNERYRTRLDVRLARSDLLADGQGGLDPTRRAWRALESSAFVGAFDAWPDGKGGRDENG